MIDVALDDKYKDALAKEHKAVTNARWDVYVGGMDYYYVYGEDDVIPVDIATVTASPFKTLEIDDEKTL